MEKQDISMPVAKATSAFAAAGLTWSEWAAILAAFYTLLLITEWWWKKLWRPLLERKGWIEKKRYRTLVQETDHSPLGK